MAACDGESPILRYLRCARRSRGSRRPWSHKSQVVNLHYMLSKASVKARPNVLWCYKKDLYLSSHRKKRMKQVHWASCKWPTAPTRGCQAALFAAAPLQASALYVRVVRSLLIPPARVVRRDIPQQVKKMAARGLLDPEKEDPFSLFVASTNIRYCYYSETHNILGNTFGMCVLQVRKKQPAEEQHTPPRRRPARLSRTHASASLRALRPRSSASSSLLSCALLERRPAAPLHQRPRPRGTARPRRTLRRSPRTSSRAPSRRSRAAGSSSSS